MTRRGETVTTPAHARVDVHGHLVEADPAFERLNDRAGGGIGEPIAVPQVATLVRLALRLRVLISRSVVVADGEEDLELWVRAEPDDRGVRLALTGWRRKSPWRPEPSERRNRDLMESGAEWQWEADAALRLVRLAPLAGISDAVDPMLLLGQPLTQLFAFGEAADGAMPILDALAQRIGFDDQPATLRASGRPVLLAAVPRLDRAGGFSGFAGGARALPQQQPEIGSLVSAFSERLDKALRSPLSRIVANADSISAQPEGPIAETYADYASDIATAGRHLLGLVDDLADLQAVDRADFAPAREPIDLADLARRAAGLLGVRASEAGISITRPTAEAAMPATGEFRRVLQIFVNLLGNAVRYAPRGSTVEIAVSRAGGTSVATVTDAGKGIAPGDQDRIFEKFERVDLSEPGGSGLGLYIARRLARAMNGDLAVESTPGEGAQFTLTLPARD